MATVTPVGTTTERPALNAVVGALALLAVIALVYFIARGRVAPTPGARPGAERPSQQEVPPPPAVPQR
jgi:hypothetical protein